MTKTFTWRENSPARTAGSTGTCPHAHNYFSHILLKWASDGPRDHCGDARQLFPTSVSTRAVKRGGLSSISSMREFDVLGPASVKLTIKTSGSGHPPGHPPHIFPLQHNFPSLSYMAQPLLLLLLMTFTALMALNSLYLCCADMP